MLKSLWAILRGRHRYGHRHDPIDSRDRLYREIAAPERMSIPRGATLLPTPLVIKSQRWTGSCSGQSVSQGVRIAFAVGNDAPCEDLSALFVYYNARKEDDTGMADDGATLRSAIKGVQKLGVCAESKWPFSVLRVNKMPDWAAYRAAHGRRGVRGYYRIEPGDVLAVKAAIASKRPVVGGWMVNEVFEDYRGGVMTKLAPPFLGGHGLVLVEYDGPVFKFVNSWGADYGEHGYGRVDEAFVGNAIDLWAIDV